MASVSPQLPQDERTAPVNSQPRKKRERGKALGWRWCARFDTCESRWMLPPEAFRHKKGGRICRKCELRRANELRAKRRKTDPEYRDRLRTRGREYWQRVGQFNPKQAEKRRQIALASYHRRAAADPDFYAKRAAQKRKWYRKNEAARQAKLAYAKKYRELHREEVLAYKRALYQCEAQRTTRKPGRCERRTSDVSRKCAYHRQSQREAAA